MFLDNDMGLALDVKRLYDKRRIQLEHRMQMGV